MRTERFASLSQLRRFDDRRQGVDERPSIAHTKVVDRPDVWARQLEHEEHLSRPPADSPHRAQSRNDRLIVECLQLVEWNGSVAALGCEVQDGGGLIARESSFTQGLGGRLKYGPGRDRTAECFD